MAKDLAKRMPSFPSSVCKEKSWTACFIMSKENQAFFLPCLAYMPYQDSSIFFDAVQFKHSGFCSFLASTVFRGILEKVGAVRRVIGARE